MRGTDEGSGSLFSYVDLEARVPKDHPLRTIREIVNGALSELNADFALMYAPPGRPSIPPEKLLRASLLQTFYTIRSERQLMERLQFDLLFRWFVGLGIDDAVWDHSVFSKNRDRVLEGDVAAKFMAAVLTQPNVKQPLSTDHFSVDGTLVEAWASMKSLKPKKAAGDDEPPTSGGRNEEVDFLVRSSTLIPASGPGIIAPPGDPTAWCAKAHLWGGVRRLARALRSAPLPRCRCPRWPAKPRRLPSAKEMRCAATALPSA